MLRNIRLCCLAVLIQLPCVWKLQAATDGSNGVRYTLIISGIGGEPKYDEAHWNWARGIYNVLHEEHKIPQSRLFLLVPDPTIDPALPAKKSSLITIEQIFDTLSYRLDDSDLLFVILIGHGSATGRDPKLNIPGPDLTASKLNDLLNAVKASRVVLVNGSSSSGPFIDAISASNRVVITATKSGGQRIATVFTEHFLSALSVENSDLNKDGRVSILEAFTYTRLKTAEWYEDQGRLATEHPMLDDNGDRKGSRDPGGKDPDGALARSITFGERAWPGETVPDLSPEENKNLAKLEARSQDIQGQIDALKLEKDAIMEDDYNSRLENLLISLARVNREIRTLTSR